MFNEMPKEAIPDSQDDSAKSTKENLLWDLKRNDALCRAQRELNKIQIEEKKTKLEYDKIQLEEKKYCQGTQ